MKKVAANADKKLKLNKTTIIKLTAVKLGKIWGGYPGPGSTTPNCNTTQSETEQLLNTL
ncbi:class I lanthipeptide [uncultured Chitinophaga sp.]|jgi:hypothetical protein|uniref:class I lanthipeptide n=1 Tax=uncultured Chitinophaga sp. TaxID=339340 RepID=UPI002614B710|nr:class I lanthipeptide [uncultured Chitinophaga sp.]